jgi:hypothetical protein
MILDQLGDFTQCGADIKKMLQHLAAPDNIKESRGMAASLLTTLHERNSVRRD